MAEPLKITTTATPEAMSKIRAGLLALDPKAKGKITLSIDQYGHLQASAGIRGTVKKVTVTLSGYGTAGGGGKPEGGVEVGIGWDPAP